MRALNAAPPLIDGWYILETRAISSTQLLSFAFSLDEETYAVIITQKVPHSKRYIFQIEPAYDTGGLSKALHRFADGDYPYLDDLQDAYDAELEEAQRKPRDPRDIARDEAFWDRVNRRLARAAAHDERF